MPTERTWQEWLERLYNLRRDKRGSHERPHKPVLLLSILDLLDRGRVKNNQVALTPELVGTFRRYFVSVVRDTGSSKRGTLALRAIKLRLRHPGELCASGQGGVLEPGCWSSRAGAAARP